MRLTVSLENETEGRLLASVNMDDVMKHITKWKPYPESEPEEDGEYLIAWLEKDSTRKRCFFEIQEYENGEWQINIPQACGHEVIVYAWMPLPEMYEV